MDINDIFKLLNGLGDEEISKNTKQFTEILNGLGQKEKMHYLAYIMATIKNPTDKDGPLGFLLLDLFKKVNSLENDLQKINLKYMKLKKEIGSKDE